MFKKKSIVLSDISDVNKKAVMTLEEDSVGLKGLLRLYNFSNELSGVSSLGFYTNKKVYKAGLTFKSRMLYEFFIDMKQIPSVFSCAVVNFQNATPKPILYGSSNGSGNQVYGEIISEISQNSSYEGVKKVLDDHDIDFDQEEKEIIEKEIDKAICDKDCASCVYKKFFYEHQESVAQAEENKNLKIKEETKPKEEVEKNILFIDKLKPQIDKLFEKHPLEENLQKLIPASKWVKVEYEDDGDFFVFGLLYDEFDCVKYVCYGVPSVFDEAPPEELAGFPIWMPLDKENAKGFGYWLTYQDASTGEPIKAIID